MSYSFTVKCADKAALKLAVTCELAKVIEAQAVHETDADQAFVTAESFINLMQNDPARDMICLVRGSIWKNKSGVQSVSVGVGVSFVERSKEPGA